MTLDTTTMNTKANKTLLVRVHALSGTVGLLIILTFFLSTVVVEIGGEEAAIQTVKRWIAWGLLLLVPTMAAAGLSGSTLSGKSQAPIIQRKKRRMALIAANGALVLVPCALLLHGLASGGSFGTAFYVIQAVELVAGPVNIVLMGLNVFDGLRLTARM